MASTPLRFPMIQAVSGRCPICDNTANLLQIVSKQHYDCNKITCRRCGYYALANPEDIRELLTRLDAIQIKTYATDPTPTGRHSTYSFLEAVSKTAYASKVKTDSSEARAVISHAISKEPVVRILDYDNLTNILTRTDLPTPADQADSLLRYIGSKLNGFGDTFAITKEVTKLKILTQE